MQPFLMDLVSAASLHLMTIVDAHTMLACALLFHLFMLMWMIDAGHRLFVRLREGLARPTAFDPQGFDAARVLERRYDALFCAARVPWTYSLVVSSRVYGCPGESCVNLMLHGRCRHLGACARFISRFVQFA